MQPWTLDFTPDDAGNPPFPLDWILNPYRLGDDQAWTTDDWDPALRFWTLPYDRHLGEWLRSTDPSLPSIQAAREFGGQPDRWRHNEADLIALGWLEPEDLAWRADPNILGGPAVAAAAERTRANGIVRAEIEQLQMLMQDDRERYLAEADVQADGLPDYVIHFLAADRCSNPWTVELIACGLAIGNLVYNNYKNQFARVRPSFLCPGLVPPFGPPRHPAFPSGHSFLGHLIALLLLEIPGIARRYGISNGVGEPGIAPSVDTVLAGRSPVGSPLLWLAARLAKNRERIGVHYDSDSFGSRHLAAGVWWALLHEGNAAKRIVCPTLQKVLRKARAEWP